jgi:hypothetical protein
MIGTVTGDTAHFVHDGVFFLRDTVYESRFAHIGPADDRDNWQWHVLQPF